MKTSYRRYVISVFILFAFLLGCNETSIQYSEVPRIYTGDGVGSVFVAQLEYAEFGTFSVSVN